MQDLKEIKEMEEDFSALKSKEATALHPNYSQEDI